jgi:hypothetical protein
MTSIKEADLTFRSKVVGARHRVAFITMRAVATQTWSILAAKLSRVADFLFVVFAFRLIVAGTAVAFDDIFV